MYKSELTVWTKWLVSDEVKMQRHSGDGSQNMIESQLEAAKIETAKLDESLVRIKEEKKYLQLKCNQQSALLRNLDEELSSTKERARELSSTVEQQRIEALQLQKQKQVLEGEVEAFRMEAEVYREDFLTEREDRVAAHAQRTCLEDHYDAEITNLREQLQAISAESNQLTQQIETERASHQLQLAEKDECIENIIVDKQTLQADVVEIKLKSTQLMSENETLIKEKQELQSQVEAFNLQVAAYKADFEDERKDREAAHGMVAFMESTIAELVENDDTGREYRLEPGRDAIIKELRVRLNHEMQTATEELQRHKDKLKDLEVEYETHVHNTSEEIEKLKCQITQAKSEHHAKVSQVKQYAKENESLKKKIQELSSVDDGLLNENMTLSAENKKLTDEVNTLRQVQRDLSGLWQAQRKNPPTITPSVLLRARSPDVPTQDDPAYKQLVRPQAILQMTTQDLQANKSQDNSRRAEETGDQMVAEGSVFQESRTTHLEKKLDLLQQDMQVISVENEKLRKAVFQVKGGLNQTSAACDVDGSEKPSTSTNGSGVSDSVVDNNVESCRKVRPMRILSDGQLPSRRERSRSPSPVAVVKPIRSQSPHSPYLRRQASVGPIMAQVAPSGARSPPSRGLSFPPSQYEYSIQPQQDINSVENVKVKEETETSVNPQVVKTKVVEYSRHEDTGDDDRPFDPNLVCLTCKKQYRIGEIQEYRKHFKACQMREKKVKPLLLDTLRQSIFPAETQPFTPILSLTQEQSGSSDSEDLEVANNPCRTPSCANEGHQKIGGLCPVCYGERKK